MGYFNFDRVKKLSLKERLEVAIDFPVGNLDNFNVYYKVTKSGEIDQTFEPILINSKELIVDSRRYKGLAYYRLYCDVKNVLKFAINVNRFTESQQFIGPLDIQTHSYSVCIDRDEIYIGCREFTLKQLKSIVRLIESERPDFKKKYRS